MEDILSAECIAYANQKIRVRLTVIGLQLTNRQQQDKTNKNNEKCGQSKDGSVENQCNKHWV